MSRKHKAAVAPVEDEVPDYATEPTPTETEPMDYQDHNEADAEAGYDDVPTKDIRIGAMSLTVRLPFKEGHVCTAAEARALNQTRLENIRNTATAKAKAASEKNLDLGEVLEEIRQYEASYEFTIGSKRGPRIGSVSRDPVDVEERRLARESLHKLLKDRGYVLKEVAEEQKEAILERFLQSGHYRAQAEANVKAREQLMLEASDILGEVQLPEPAPKEELAEAAE